MTLKKYKFILSLSFFLAPLSFTPFVFSEKANRQETLQQIEKQIQELISSEAKNSPSKDKITSIDSILYRIKSLEIRLQVMEEELHRTTNLLERLEHTSNNQHPKKNQQNIKDESNSLSFANKAKENKEPLNTANESSETISLDNRLPKKEADVFPSRNKNITLSKDDVEAYNTIQKTIRENKFSIASSQLRDFLQKYPKSPLRANILYWAGEIARSQNNDEQAANFFLKVYTEHPDHPKAPESLFKLAYTLKKLSKPDEAKATLQRLKREYPSIDETLSSMVEKLESDIEKPLIHS